LLSLRSSTGVIALLRNIRAVNPKPLWDIRAIELLRSLATTAQKIQKAETFDEVAKLKESFYVEWSPLNLDRLKLDIFMRSDVLDEIARTDDNMTAIRV
jgi:hypothetical protein